jgi:hypothetical protein
MPEYYSQLLREAVRDLRREEYERSVAFSLASIAKSLEDIRDEIGNRDDDESMAGDIRTIGIMLYAMVNGS